MLLYGDGVNYTSEQIKARIRVMFAALEGFDQAVDEAIIWLELRDYVWLNDDHSDEPVVQLTTQGIAVAEAVGARW